MAIKFFARAPLIVAALASSTPWTLAVPRCVDSVARFPASAINFDISSGTLPPNATVPISGTFGIQIRFCEPTVDIVARADTVQVLVHGITYDTEYWDSSFEPESYSYVRFAAAQGYATINMARLGHGESDHPDPVAVVQTPFEITIIQSIINAVRSGSITGATRGFGTVVYVGHSFGSILLNGVIASEPDLVDAAVFTGYGHDPAETGPIAGILGLGPARDIDPARFGDLPPGYLTTSNAMARAAGFYGAAGTFDPAALAFDEAHKYTVTMGEAFTLPVPVTAAPHFKGDVFTINGVDDIIYCPQPGCANLASEGQFYPAAKSVGFSVVPLTGHSLNFHLSAPAFYATLQAWLTLHGY
ncbi:alpha/beta-hydrolase [Auricularia subglabra TFB-10046 SS5]|nr:alpha/beta-hydrolase [Auricularia subglabra TFB-10046 SS5]